MEKPVVYIFHGDDPLAIRRYIDEMVSKMGDDPAIADLNITRLDGRHASDDDMRSAANAMPFLAERRMVIITYPLARLTTDSTRKRFLAFLDGLPPSTALVLAIEDSIEQRKWKSLPAVESNWLRKWLKAASDRAVYRLCELPSLEQMVEWIRKEAKRQGGQFSPDAARSLAAHVGNDTQTASLEIDKLLTYVDRKRAVDASDVEELTAQGGQADVFTMVDSLAVGDARLALSSLHRLLETQDPLSLFGMITRQFRLLLQAREVLDEGRGGQIASQLRLHPYVADKVGTQARRFTIEQLEDFYHRLLDLDEAMKTSQMPSDLALDTFIASLART